MFLPEHLVKGDDHLIFDDDDEPLCCRAPRQRSASGLGGNQILEDHDCRLSSGRTYFFAVLESFDEQKKKKDIEALIN